MLFDLLILTAVEKNHNSIGTHRLSSSVSSKLSDHPHWIGRKREKNVKEKKAGGNHFFLQVILFIPEQLENTSLNVNPESFQSLIHQRSDQGWGLDKAATLRAAHTHTAQRIPENPRADR